MLDSIVWVFLTFIMRRVLVPRARVHTHRTPAEGAPSLFCHGGVRTPPFFPPLPALFWTQVTTTSCEGSFGFALGEVKRRRR